MTFIFTLLTSFFVAAQGVLFLYFMQFCMETFTQYPDFIYGLPFIGLLTVWTYKKISPQILSTKSLLHQSNLEQSHISFWISPLVIFFSSLSQLGGASTGREGSALQIGAATAEKLFYKLKPKFDRTSALRMGMASGFGAVFGTPLAASIFVLEIARPQKNWQRLPWYFLSAHLGTAFSKYMGAPHLQLPQIELIPFDFKLFYQVPLFALLLAFTGFIFSKTYHQIERLVKKVNPYSAVLIGTTAMVVMTKLLHQTTYNGIGVEFLENSLSFQTQSLDSFLKSVATILSATCGLKGGEVTPVLAIGASLGSVFGQWIHFVHPIFPAVGACVFFGSISGTPIAAAFLAADLFGWNVFIPCLVLSSLCHFFAGKEKLFISEL